MPSVCSPNTPSGTVDAASTQDRMPTGTSSTPKYANSARAISARRRGVVSSAQHSHTPPACAYAHMPTRRHIHAYTHHAYRPQIRICSRTCIYTRIPRIHSLDAQMLTCTPACIYTRTYTHHTQTDRACAFDRWGVHVCMCACRACVRVRVCVQSTWVWRVYAMCM